MRSIRVRTHLWLRRCRQLLGVETGDRRTIRDWSRSATEVVWIVRFFYLFTAYEMSHGALSRAHRGDPTEPLWPIALVSRTVGLDWLGNDVVVSLLPTALGLLAVAVPGILAVRAAVFLYLLVTVAFHNSYGAENHGSHFFVYVSFALLFLPRSIGWGKATMRRGDAMACIATFWLAQAIVLLTYSLAGAWKVWASGMELLAPDSFARILLHRMYSDAQPVPVLLPLAVTHMHVSWLLFLGLVYVQCASIFALFRPHLHRPLGIALILFHFGTDWLMNISFQYRIAFVGLFLVFSPLAPVRHSWLATLRSLPLLGVPFSLWAALRTPSSGQARAWLVFDGECPLCTRYAAYMNARSAIGELALVDAREGGPVVEEVRGRGLVLDDGMVLKMNGRYYHGEDALVALALMSERRGVFSVLNRMLLGSRRMAGVAYPLMRLARHVALRIKGVSHLDI